MHDIINNTVLKLLILCCINLSWGLKNNVSRLSIIVITQILSNPIFFGVAGKTFTEKKLVFKSLPIQFLEGVTEEYPMNFKRFGKKHSQSISEFFFAKSNHNSLQTPT